VPRDQPQISRGLVWDETMAFRI